MCLGIPMKVMKIEDAVGIVGSGSVQRRADLSLMKNVRVGDYILMHAGFAIEKVKEKEARKTLNALKSIRP